MAVTCVSPWCFPTITRTSLCHSATGVPQEEQITGVREMSTLSLRQYGIIGSQARRMGQWRPQVFSYGPPGAVGQVWVIVREPSATRAVYNVHLRHTRRPVRFYRCLIVNYTCLCP